MKAKVALSFLVVLASLDLEAAVPVHDPLSFAQKASHFLKEVAHFEKQIADMERSYERIKYEISAAERMANGRNPILFLKLP
jgi:hypothetical protein